MEKTEDLNAPATKGDLRAGLAKTEALLKRDLEAGLAATKVELTSTIEAGFETFAVMVKQGFDDMGKRFDKLTEALDRAGSGGVGRSHSEPSR